MHLILDWDNPKGEHIHCKMYLSTPRYKGIQQVRCNVHFHSLQHRLVRRIKAHSIPHYIYRCLAYFYWWFYPYILHFCIRAKLRIDCKSFQSIHFHIGIYQVHHRLHGHICRYISGYRNECQCIFHVMIHLNLKCSYILRLFRSLHEDILLI